MNIQIAQKSLSRKRPAFVPYDFPDEIESLQDFITALVKLEVARFNAGPPNEHPLPEDAIWIQKNSGKVAFGARYNDSKVDPDYAVNVALTGFQDGLYRVFINDLEVQSLNAPVTLTPGCKITLIRLTFLAGRMW